MLIVGEKDRLADDAPLQRRIGRPGLQMIDQRVAIDGDRTAVIAPPRKGLERLNGSRRRIKPHTIGQPSVAVGVVGENEGDGFFCVGFAFQRHPFGGEVDDEIHAVRCRLMADNVAFHRRIEPGNRLERDGSRQNPAIDLRQGDRHGEIAGAKPLRGCPPGVLGRRRQHRLQHHRTAFFQHGRHTLTARRGYGKARQIDNDVRLRTSKDLPHGLDADGILETGHKQRQGRQPAPLQGGAQGGNRLQLPRLHKCAIENDGNNRQSVRVGLFTDGRNPGLQKRHRFGVKRLTGDERCTTAQEAACIFRATLGQQCGQSMAGSGINGRPANEVRVRLRISRQENDLETVCVSGAAQRLHEIGPIGNTTQQPRDHQLCMPTRPLDPGVDGHGMADLHHIDEPQREAVKRRRAGRRNTGKIGVSGAQDTDISGRLAEVERLVTGVAQRAFLGGEKMHSSGRQCADLTGNRGPVQPGDANHHEAGRPCLGLQPWPVKIGIDPSADRLDGQSHRLARYGTDALQPQNVMAHDDALQGGREGRDIGHRTAIDDETIEIVVVMVMVVMTIIVFVIIMIVMVHLVMRLAVFDLVLGCSLHAEQHVDGQDATRRRHQFQGPTNMAFHIGADGSQLVGINKVGFVEHNHVGSAQLVLEQFFKRAFMVERVVSGALRIQRIMVVGEATGRHCRRVDHRHHAINRHLRLDARPVESGHQRLRQGETRGFDDDVVGLVVTLQQLRHGGNEVVGHSTADAAIGQFDNVLFLAGFRPAALQRIAIDAEITKLVDDQRDASAIGIFQHVADERCLARTEETGDDGGGDLLAEHVLPFQGQWQSCCHEIDLLRNRRDVLMQASRMVTKFSCHFVVRHDPETDFV